MGLKQIGIKCSALLKISSPLANKLKRWSSLGKERADLALEEKGFDGIISRKINRKISAPIAEFLYNRNQNINPDHLTLIPTGIGLGAAAVFYLSNGNPLFAILGGLLTQVSSILDGIDGDYARYLSENQRNKRQRSFGEYLDTVTDRIVDIAIIYGMGIYLSNIFPASSWVLPLTFATMGLSLLGSYTRHQITKIYTEAKFQYIKSSICYSKYRDMKYYISGKINFAGRDIRLFTFFLGGLFEGLSYISPVPKGLFLALSMGIVSFSHLAQIAKSSIELKRNLNNIEKYGID